MSDSKGPIELESEAAKLEIRPDRRHAVPEPLPVRLIAIADVRLPAPAGMETQLDDFYIRLLRFQRGDDRDTELVYHADNFDLIFQVGEPPIHRDHFDPTPIEVDRLKDVLDPIIEREIEHERQRGVDAGEDRIVLLDPAGNWIAVSERRMML